MPSEKSHSAFTPGRADGELLGDGGCGQAGVDILEDALAQVHRIGLQSLVLMAKTPPYPKLRPSATPKSDPL
jgi:hypothetical protein